MGSFTATLICVLHLSFTIASKNTKDCCWPDTFEATLGTSAGMPLDRTYDVNYVDYHVAFDFPNGLWGAQIRHIFVTGDYEEIIWIEDHKEGTLTVASAVHGCKKAPLPYAGKLQKPCIPDAAKRVRASSMGVPGKTLRYDVWEWETEGDPNSDNDKYAMVMNAHVLRGGSCLPLYEIGWFNDKNLKLNANLGFHDVQMGIGEENLFKVVQESYQCEWQESVESGINFPFKRFPRLQSLKEFKYLARRLNISLSSDATKK